MLPTGIPHLGEADPRGDTNHADAHNEEEEPKADVAQLGIPQTLNSRETDAMNEKWNISRKDEVSILH